MLDLYNRAECLLYDQTSESLDSSGLISRSAATSCWQLALGTNCCLIVSRNRRVFQPQPDTDLRSIDAVKHSLVRNKRELKAQADEVYNFGKMLLVALERLLASSEFFI